MPSRYLSQAADVDVLCKCLQCLKTSYYANNSQISLPLDALQVYVAWNVHEPEAGRFDWDGQADLAAWLTLAAEEGLLAVLRPGPYICAEWDFGGLPWWLASKKVGQREVCVARVYGSAVVIRVDFGRRIYFKSCDYRPSPVLEFSHTSFDIFCIQVKSKVPPSD